jgi:predicted nucleic acid-binding protein
MGRADRARAGAGNHRDPLGGWLLSPVRARAASWIAAAPVVIHAGEYLAPAIENRTVEVLTLLADRGQHRAPSIPDLIIAASAELAGLTVLHLDNDFEVIAQVTGQPLERLSIGQ